MITDKDARDIQEFMNQDVEYADKEPKKDYLSLDECIEYAENDPKLEELGEDTKQRVIDSMKEDKRKQDKAYWREMLDICGME